MSYAYSTNKPVNYNVEPVLPLSFDWSFFRRKDLTKYDLFITYHYMLHHRSFQKFLQFIFFFLFV